MQTLWSLGENPLRNIETQFTSSEPKLASGCFTRLFSNLVHAWAPMNEKAGKPHEYAIQQHYGQGDRWVLASLSSPKQPKPQKVGEKDKT